MPTTILTEVLKRRFHISRAILDRKRRLIKKAKDSLQIASRSLAQEGHAISLTRDGLMIRDKDIWLIGLCDTADPLLVRGLKSKYNPSELFLICWSAKESVVRSALNEELHLAILSRGQVIYKNTPLSKTALEFMRKAGLTFEKFRSLALGGSESFDYENSLLSELMTLREMFNNAILKDNLNDKVIRLLDELEEMSQRGAEEKDMNDLLIAVLEAYPVEIDEGVSGKSGMPDVVAYTPIWILFELKNERAIKRHVDQLRGYLNWFKGYTSSPLEIPWKGLLVALDSPPEIYAYALKRDVRVISWDALVKFLKHVFLDAIPIEFLREAMNYADVERGLSDLVSQWKRDISSRIILIKTLKKMGMLSKRELAGEMASQVTLGKETLDFIIHELSGPILGLIRKEEEFFLAREGDPFPRVERAVASLRRDLHEKVA